MSVVTVDEVDALVHTGLAPDDLQDVIDRNEAWLAGKLGQLEGERTDTIWIAPGDADPLLLQRPTDAVEVDDDQGDEIVDVVLTGPARIERRLHAWPGRFVDVKFEPNDLGAVKRAIIELVRIDVTASPYNQEATQGHSYSRPLSAEGLRDDIVRSLNPHRGPGTIRASNGASHRITS